MFAGTVEDWRTYASLRGNRAPTDAADVDAESALVRAFDYIRTRYVIRYDLEDEDPKVTEATYIAANYELLTPGFWTTTFTPSQIKVLTKVDAIQWTPIKSDDSGLSMVGDGQLPTDPAIHALLTVGSRWGLPAVFVV